jgi:hypothetical protein
MEAAQSLPLPGAFVLHASLTNLAFVLQSGYFSSMFKGSWKESNMNKIQLQIPEDDNINVDGERCSFCRVS